MNTEQQIRASVVNGLTRSEIEAFLGRKFTEGELATYNKAKALVKLQKRKEKKEKEKEKKEDAKAILKRPTTNKLEVVHVGQSNPQQLPPLSKRYTKEQIEDVIVRAHGLTSSICTALDCTTQQFYVYLRNKPEMKQLQEDCRMDFINEAERVVMENLHDPDPSIRQQAAQYVLNRLGRTKGWGEDRLFGITVSQDEQTKQIRAIFGIEQ